MSVELDSFCYGCHYRRNVATARSLGDEATATAFARELMQLYLDTPVAGSASPLLSPGTTALFQKYYGLDADRFRQEKEMEMNRGATPMSAYCMCHWSGA